VQPGDTLSDIADELGTTVEALAELNGLTNLNHLVTGTKLTAPASEQSISLAATVSYLVEAGDTLWGIAESFGVTLLELAELNGLGEDDYVIEGTELQVPSKPVANPEPPPDKEHRVVAGETLSGIADYYGATVAALVAANPSINPDIIEIGDVLRIPAFALPDLSPITAQALRDTSIEFNIDPFLLLALSLMESGWQSHVVSHAGAIGLMQLMPDTARWTVAHLTPAATNWHISVEDNARVGGAYLDHLLFLEGGDIEAALASYYQGWASFKIHGMFEETRAYVDGILALAERLRTSDIG
jgi:LysM repeat protein